MRRTVLSAYLCCTSTYCAAVISDPVASWEDLSTWEAESKGDATQRGSLVPCGGPGYFLNLYRRGEAHIIAKHLIIANTLNEDEQFLRWVPGLPAGVKFFSRT